MMRASLDIDPEIGSPPSPDDTQPCNPPGFTALDELLYRAFCVEEVEEE